MVSETDPLLLPRAYRSQSHRKTINDVGVVVHRDAEDSRWGVNDAIAYCAILMTFVFFLVSILPDGFLKSWPHWRPSAPPTIDQRVDAILSKTPLIDGHNDLAIMIRVWYNNHIYGTFQKQFAEGGMPLHVDLPRLREGRVGGAFWAAFVPCPPTGTDFSDGNYVESIAWTYNQIDLLHRLRTFYPNHFSPPPDSTTAISYFHAKQLISPLAIEGLHQIGNSISNLRNYHSLGVRYATLTHNCHNAYADAALTEGDRGEISKATPYWGGVSPAGRKLIREMNRLGMIVDLSHVSPDTMLDVLGGNSTWPGSAAPPIFSHSSAYGICPHPRNVPDNVLQLVKARNSLVMVNFSPDFISCVSPSVPNKDGLPDFYPQNSTLEHVVDHIVYIGKLIGYDHVGLGSDFDGIPTTPMGLDDVSKFPNLVAEMLRRGISDTDASKVIGGNLLRVWAEVDDVASKMQADGEIPLEDDLPSLEANMRGAFTRVGLGLELGLRN